MRCMIVSGMYLLILSIQMCKYIVRKIDIFVLSYCNEWFFFIFANFTFCMIKLTFYLVLVICTMFDNYAPQNF